MAHYKSTARADLGDVYTRITNKIVADLEGVPRHGIAHGPQVIWPAAS